MKTQNNFFRAPRISGLAFAAMLTIVALNASSFGFPYTEFTRPETVTGDRMSARDYQEIGLAPSVSHGVYDLSFWVWRTGSLEPVSSLPVSGGPLVLFAHVEDAAGNPADGGTVTFEFCGDYEPKEACDSGQARWTRLGRVSIGSCYCKSCGGLPGYDPGPGNACIFVFDSGSIPGDDGYRFKYAGGRRTVVDSGMSGAANFTWLPAS